MIAARKSSFAGFFLVCLLPLGFAARTAAAAEPGVPEGFELGWHTVRPGETLESITARYLGSSQAWPQVARLNPDVADPHWIRPGQRIRVFLPRRSGLPVARVERLSRRVEQQPSPIPWIQAQSGDLLVERDGIRTFRKSSAEMAFSDGMRLLVTEDSLIFLQRTAGGLKGVDRKSLEIVQGQADVEARPSAARPASAARPEVEIVLGNTRTTARPDRSGVAQTRARRPAEGGAKLMVYGGEGEIEAGGAKVQVPQGMGTSVAETGPPAPPEKLLPAPRALAPEPDAEVVCANPAFSWEPVAEAESYIVEVCSDPGCGSLVERATGITAPDWRAAALPASELFWRVTARSSSGLDGYPSEPARLKVTSDLADAQSPGGTLAVTGSQVYVAGTLFVAPGARLELAAADTKSGVARWVPLINGQESGAETAGGPWKAGRYEAGAVVVDRCGNLARVKPVAFTVDAEAPALEPDLVGQDALADRSLKTRKGARGNPVAWSGGAQWYPLPSQGEAVRIASDEAQVFFRAPGARFSLDGREVVLGEDQMLRVRAEDAESRVEHLTFRTRREGGGIVLEIETADLVGNVRKGEWRLALP